MSFSSAVALENDGKTRIRFENISKRLQKVNVDILHKKPESVYLNATRETPDAGEVGCFLQDEMERLKTLDMSPPFKRLCYQLYPCIQSMPELVHHQRKVIDILLNYLKTTSCKLLSSALSLIAVLARDLGEDINTYFHAFLSTMCSIVDKVAVSGGVTDNDEAPNPELTGKLFETMAHLLRANLSHLSEHPDELSEYYGPLLGSPVGFIRDFASKTFIIILRKLSPAVFKTHSKRLFKAVSAQIAHALHNDLSQLSVEYDSKYEQLSTGLKRTKWIIHGMVKYYFACFKGIQGHLHSKAMKRYAQLFEQFQHIFETTVTSTQTMKEGEEVDMKALFHMKTYGPVLYQNLVLMTRFVYEENQFEFIEVLLTLLASAVKSVLTVVQAAENNKMNNQTKTVIALFVQILLKLMLFILGNQKVFEEQTQIVKLTSSYTYLSLQLLQIMQLTTTADDEDNNNQNVPLFRQLLQTIWLLFPTHKKLNEQLPTYLTLLCSKPSNLLHCIEHLMKKLPSSLVNQHCLPIVFESLNTLSSQLPATQWITLSNQVFFALQDVRDNLDHQLLFSSTSNAAEDTNKAKLLRAMSTNNIQLFKFEPSVPAMKILFATQWELFQKKCKVKPLLKLLFPTEDAQKKKSTVDEDDGEDEEGEGEGSKIEKAEKKMAEVCLLLRCMMWWIVHHPNLMDETALPIFQTTVFKLIQDIVLSKKTKKLLSTSMNTSAVALVSNIVLLFAMYCKYEISSPSADKQTLLQVYQQVITHLLPLLQQHPVSIAMSHTIAYLLQHYPREEDSQDTAYLLSTLLSPEDCSVFVEKIGLALVTGSYWVKLNLLQILSHVQPPIDRSFQEKHQHDSDEIRYLDAVKVCLEIQLTPIDLRSERDIIRRLEILEVLSRGTKLPKEFLAIIAGYCLSFTFVKFKPVWNAAITVLVTISNNTIGEELLWPILSSLIEEVTHTTDSSGAMLENEEVDQTQIIDMKTIFTQLIQYDNGKDSVTNDVAKSIFFWVSLGEKACQLTVPLDARADMETVCLLLFELLHKAPNITLKRSKTIVSIFIRFLQQQYYRGFAEESEIPSLQIIGLLEDPNKQVVLTEGTEEANEVTENAEELPLLPRRSLLKRLEAFLKIFSVVPSPKQLFKHGLLYGLYHELLAKPDIHLSKLAYECILTYKPVALAPYKEHIKNFFDDRLMRNQLITLEISPNEARADDFSAAKNEENIVKPEHYDGLFPVLIRLLYGRLMSKPTAKRSEKDQNIARRTAVLAFITKMGSHYIQYFLYLMMRGMVSLERQYTCYVNHPEVFASASSSSSTPIKYFADIGAVKQFHDQEYQRIAKTITTLQGNEELRTSDDAEREVMSCLFDKISWERLQGFLFLLQPTISVLGYGLTSYMNDVNNILMLILKYSQLSRAHQIESFQQSMSALTAEMEIENGEEVGHDEIEDAENEEAEEDDESDLEINEDLKQAEMNGITSRYYKSSNAVVAVRSLALQRFAESIEQFHTVVSFTNSTKIFFQYMKPLLLTIADTVSNAKKLPAIFEVMHQLIIHSETIPVFTIGDYSEVLAGLMECIAIHQVELEINKSFYNMMGCLLDYEHGKLLIPFAELVVTMFTKRFSKDSMSVHKSEGMKKNDSYIEKELKLSDVEVSNVYFAKRELHFLCRLTSEIFTLPNITVHATSVYNLATLLLGLLRVYMNSRKTRVSEDWVLNILQIYQSLLSRMTDVSQHVSFFSRLFGPSAYPTSLFNVNIVRNALVKVYVQLSEHPSVNYIISSSALLMGKLVKLDKSIIDSRDYSTFTPVVQQLMIEATEEGTTEMKANDEEKKWTWNDIIGPESFARVQAHIQLLTQQNNALSATNYVEPKSAKKKAKKSEVKAVVEPVTSAIAAKPVFVPTSYNISNHISVSAVIIFELIRCVYDVEHAVRASAATALKQLIKQALCWHTSAVAGSNASTSEWLYVITTILLPAIRRGIHSSTDMVKSQFLALFSIMIRLCAEHGLTSPDDQATFHTDLVCLQHPDDPDQDFFENIVYIQLHRRTRAFMKLRQQLMVTGDEKSSSIGDKITTSSYMHILLPIGMYYLTSEEFNKKIHQHILEEIPLFISSIAFHLPWNHYNGLLKRLLKLIVTIPRSSLPNKDEKEKHYQLALSSVLNSFHFDVHASIHQEQIKQVIEDEEDVEDIEEGDGEVEVIPKEEGMEVEAEEESKEEDELKANEENQVVKKTSNEVDDAGDDEDCIKSDTIGHVIVHHLLPRLKSLLVKDVKDQNDEKTTTVQMTIALAYTNIIKQLQGSILTKNMLRDLLSNLIITVIQTLKSKDLYVRDNARQCLLKILNIFGISSYEKVNVLKIILYELQSILIEGYQRHVGLFSIRSILVNVMDSYHPDYHQIKSIQMDELNALTTLTSKTITDYVTLFPLDECIPYIMQSVLFDLSDDIRDDTAAKDGIIRSSIKEMRGSKYNEILEITAKHIIFRPTYALLTPREPEKFSSIHGLSMPLINYLANVDYELDNQHVIVGRINEALQRIALGISRNVTIKEDELLLYVHATLQPFLQIIVKQYKQYQQSFGLILKKNKIQDDYEANQKHTKKSRLGKNNNNNNKNQQPVKSNEALLAELQEEVDFHDIESFLPSYLRGDSDEEEEETFAFQRKTRINKKDITNFQAATWLPRDWQSLKEQRDVIEERNRQQKEHVRVQDGASAPKLTGRNRYDKKLLHQSSQAGYLNIDKSHLIAIRYCLTLFYNVLKKKMTTNHHHHHHNKVDIDDDTVTSSSLPRAQLESMLLPFIPILQCFLSITSHHELMVLALKCISQLISWGIVLTISQSQFLSQRILVLLIQTTSHGSKQTTQEQELCQVCLQTLMMLFKQYNTNNNTINNSNNNAEDESRLLETGGVNTTYPLSLAKMKTLIEILTLTIVENSILIQNIIFQLIKEIITSRVLLSELYDLMIKITDMMVLSHDQKIRDVSSSIILTFLITYPMARTRMESQLKLLLKQCSYQYEDGRYSAYQMIYLIIKSFPIALLEEYGTMFFLALTISYSNESSSKCRDSIMNSLFILIRKLPRDLVNQFQGFGMTWLMTLLQYITQRDQHLLLSTTAVTDSSVPLLLPHELTSDKLSLIKIGAQINFIIIKARSTEIGNQKIDYLRQMIIMIYYNLRLLLTIPSKQHDHQVNYHQKGGYHRIQFWHEDIWNIVYHLLLLLEQCYLSLPMQTDYVLTHFITCALNCNPSVSLLQIPSLSKVLQYPSSTSAAVEKVPTCWYFMNLINELIFYKHHWIRAVSLRIMNMYSNKRILTNPKVKRIGLYPIDNESNEILLQPNNLYHIMRRLCLVLNHPTIPKAVFDNLAVLLVGIIRVMIHHPELDCYDKKISDNDDNDSEVVNDQDDVEVEEDNDNDEVEVEDEDNGDEDDEVVEAEEQHEAEEEEVEEDHGNAEETENLLHLEVDQEDGAAIVVAMEEVVSSNVIDIAIAEEEGKEADEVLPGLSKGKQAGGKRGLSWVMQRMRAIGADIRGDRRVNVLQILLALVNAESSDFLRIYIDQILEVPVRIELSHVAKQIAKHDITDESLLHMKELSTELLQSIEMKLGAMEYMTVFADMQRKVQHYKLEKKHRSKLEFVTNPKSAAQKKIDRNQQKKFSQKRQMAKQMLKRGVKKRRFEK